VLDKTVQQRVRQQGEIGVLNCRILPGPAITPGKPRAIGQNDEIVEGLFRRVAADKYGDAPAKLLERCAGNLRFVADVGARRAYQRHKNNGPILNRDLQRPPSAACRMVDQAWLSKFGQAALA